MAELCRCQMLELACSAKAAKLAALRPTASLYGNVLEPRACSYYCLQQILLCRIWALRRGTESRASRAANDWRKMTKGCAAVQKALPQPVENTKSELADAMQCRIRIACSLVASAVQVNPSFRHQCKILPAEDWRNQGSGAAKQTNIGNGFRLRWQIQKSTHTNARIS